MSHDKSAGLLRAATIVLGVNALGITLWFVAELLASVGVIRQRALGIDWPAHAHEIGPLHLILDVALVSLSWALVIAIIRKWSHALWIAAAIAPVGIASWLTLLGSAQADGGIAGYVQLLAYATGTGMLVLGRGSVARR